jgi:hypothetical protein
MMGVRGLERGVLELAAKAVNRARTPRYKE